MKRGEWVLREILCRVYEEHEFFMSQKALAGSCGVSLDTVNRVVGRLEGFGALEKRPFGFRVLEPKKVLTYWACTRNLRGEVVYSTYSPDSPSEIEGALPKGGLLTCFSGCRRRFGGKEDYEEVYVYAEAREVKRRFGERPGLRPNLFVLRGDPHLSRRSREEVVPLPQLYVDLWGVGGNPANRYLLTLEKKLELRPVEAFKELVRAAEKGTQEEMATR